MKLYSHLKVSRHGIYYFRCVIPKPLRPFYNGKTEIKHSLNTRDPATARREAYILSAQSVHAFHAAKRAMKQYDPNNFNLNDLSTWPSAVKDVRTWEVTLPNGIQVKTDPNNPDDHKNAMEALEKIGKLPALLNVPSVVASPAPVSKTIKLSAAIVVFLQYRQENKGIADGTRDKERAIVNRFLGWTYDPHDPLIDTITSNVVDEFLDYLENVNRDEHIKAKGKLPYGPIATPLVKSSVDDYRLCLRLMFVAMKNKKFFPSERSLPTDNPRYQKGEKKKTKNANAYLPFNPHELALIFKPETFKRQKKPHEFWVPLLCLYTGSRINEICQLYLHDIKQAEEGFWFMHVHRFDGNGTKTMPSVRRSPLHNDLIALGLLDYIEDVKSLSPHGRLFPYLNWDMKNGFSARPSKSFAKYLDQKEVNIKDPRKVCHSFRSTLIQMFQDKSVKKSLYEAFVGHSFDGKSSYERDVTIEELNSLVAPKIVFPCIRDNIVKLRYNRGDFIGVLPKLIKTHESFMKNKQAKEEREQRKSASAAQNKGA